MMKRLSQISLLFVFVGCGGLRSHIPLQGELGGQKIKSTVDSSWAKYYLENYIPDKNVNQKKHAEIEKALAPLIDGSLSEESLKNLRDQFSLDFSALVLAHHLLQDPKNKPFRDDFRAVFQNLKQEEASGIFSLQPAASTTLLMFAPGWFYKAHPESGADFARPREILKRLGYGVHLIETDENGTVEANSKVIAKEIQHFRQRYQKIIIISTSKSGPEVALALGNRLKTEETLEVKSWINIGGLLKGSPLVDWALHWRRKWLSRMRLGWKGFSLRGLKSLSPELRASQLKKLQLPSHLFILNFVGIPLSGQVTKKAIKGYKKLRKKGPNDGLTLIQNEILPQSTTLVQLGLDHYFLDKDMSLKSVALAQTVIKIIQSRK